MVDRGQRSTQRALFRCRCKAYLLYGEDYHEQTLEVTLSYTISGCTPGIVRNNSFRGIILNSCVLRTVLVSLLSLRYLLSFYMLLSIYKASIVGLFTFLLHKRYSSKDEYSESVGKPNSLLLSLLSPVKMHKRID